ncbi:SDR family NAD(P)-dependent oxidoreductase [Nocardia arthritidis]|uniref:SDR family oxidoreductase n=1 Tax=Nocardia arthritidis TaxID=228602 RepID=A0A6G9YDE5_9NOCA|nr:SDR family oxidoreductase [Nocardia arthritidis]QIS11222.1 SDR family oxidoreductase [Nocardia arthritidis]
MSAQAFGGLTAIVTGGASGIGKAVSETLAAGGAWVAVLDRDLGAPTTGLAVRCDVTDDADVRAAVLTVAETYGGIDIVVNCAGIGAQGTIADHTDDEWRNVFEVNVFGTVRICRAALPHLRVSASAAIVNMCSIAATTGLPDRAVYSASKGAVLALTRAMAADHLTEGIRVNCVNPGTVDTPWVQRLLAASADPGAELTALRARQPHGRLVTAEEVAAAVAYLASPAAGSTTATMLEVDAGMHSLRLRAPASARSGQGEAAR